MDECKPLPRSRWGRTRGRWRGRGRRRRRSYGKCRGSGRGGGGLRAGCRGANIKHKQHLNAVYRVLVSRRFQFRSELGGTVAGTVAVGTVVERVLRGCGTWNGFETGAERLLNGCGTVVERLWNGCGTVVERLRNGCGTVHSFQPSPPYLAGVERGREAKRNPRRRRRHLRRCHLGRRHSRLPRLRVGLKGLGDIAHHVIQRTSNPLIELDCTT